MFDSAVRELVGNTMLTDCKDTCLRLQLAFPYALHCTLQSHCMRCNDATDCSDAGLCGVLNSAARQSSTGSAEVCSRVQQESNTLPFCSVPCRDVPCRAVPCRDRAEQRSCAMQYNVVHCVALYALYCITLCIAL
jgi:hypothetical protein